MTTKFVSTNNDNSHKTKTGSMLIGIDGNEIKMYGRIWSGDGPFILSAINPLLQSGEDITIRLHSPGGSVIDGNLVGNAIKSAPSNVHIIVDGIAASMGAIWLTKANKVSMASNGLIMVHAPSGFEEGSAKKFEQTAKVLRSMEKDFKANLKARTGQDDNVLNDWMIEDNWFDAEEAIELKLIDEIVDPIMLDVDFTAFREMNIAASLFDSRKPSIFDQYDNTEAVRTSSIITASSTVPGTPQTPLILNPNTMSDLKIDAKILAKMGLTENATAQDVEAAFEARDKKITDLQEKLGSEKTAKAKALVAQAVKDGRILGSEVEEYEKHAEANYDLTASMIAKLPTKKSPEGMITPEAGKEEENGDARKDWTFDDYRKKDPAALLRMKTVNPTAYAALIK